MYNTLDDGDILLLKKYDKTYSRNEIIVFNYQESRLVKRVIGLPGENVSYKNGKLYINNEEVIDNFSSITHDFELSQLGFYIIPEGYYFVMGDNRGNSLDSRDFRVGLIKKENIVGNTIFRLFPFNKIGTIK